MKLRRTNGGLVVVSADFRKRCLIHSLVGSTSSNEMRWPNFLFNLCFQTDANESIRSPKISQENQKDKDDAVTGPRSCSGHSAQGIKADKILRSFFQREGTRPKRRRIWNMILSCEILQRESNDDDIPAKHFVLASLPL